MGRYCYSREIKTIEGTETFAIVEAASFDEAKKEVDKGIRDRRLELGEKHFGIDPAQVGGDRTVVTPQVGPQTASTPAMPGYTVGNGPTASDAPAGLPNSPDQLPTGQEGQGAGGAS